MSDMDERRKYLADKVREIASLADELAFWRYQAIWGRVYMLQPDAIRHVVVEDTAVWKEATKQLEAAWLEDKRERQPSA